jgi:hypothetical protein
MTDLTYTIAHIKIGAEKYYEEVEGFVNGDKKVIITSGMEKLLLDFSICFAKEHILDPLSEFAKKLGAKVYGGDADEKDFYLLLPCCKKWTVGDCFITQFKDKGFIGFGEFGLTETRIYNISNSTNPLVAGFEIGLEKIGNIFQEYARTGILENDLYKQFFK